MNHQIEPFSEYLSTQNLSQNTILSYTYAVRQFFEQYGSLSREHLNAYKNHLISQYKPKTINLRISGINKYLEYTGFTDWSVPAVKVQQKPFLENVISEADYLYLKNCLKKDHEMYWYFVVRFLAATGVRVSELLQIRVEDVCVGYMDIYSKGGKLRRIYIPAALQTELLSWLKEQGMNSGYIFLNRRGTRITPRGISSQLKHFAIKYGIDPAVVYPHSFRHRFAKSFLQQCNDIAMLADLMGHESIETTRIYLRKTSVEQRAIVNRVVTW